MRIQRGLTEAAQEWATARPEYMDGYLYSGARLAASREWAATHRDELHAIEANFLAASEEAERQREQDELENERRLREAAEAAQAAERKRGEDAEVAAERQKQLGFRFLAAALVAGVLAITSGGLAPWANNARQLATAQARIAESRRLAVLSDAALPERLDLALLLALEAARQRDTLEARGSLQRSLDARPEVVRFLHVPEGSVTSVAFGPEGQIAAGYGGVRGGVVLFDAGGERLRPAPLEVKEGSVRSVAFGPEGQIAARYTGVGVGGVVLFDAGGERLRPAPLEVKEGYVSSVAYGPEGQITAGYDDVVLFDADPASWLRKAGQTANRNFTRLEWTRFFPETSYRRTIRSLPWPHDLPEAERKQAEAFEKEHPEGSDAS